MLEPQSPLFLLLLVTAFGVLVWLLVVAKRVALRIVAGCLAFIPAMMFGVAAVTSITTTTRAGAQRSGI